MFVNNTKTCFDTNSPISWDLLIEQFAEIAYEVAMQNYETCWCPPGPNNNFPRTILWIIGAHDKFILQIKGNIQFEQETHIWSGSYVCLNIYFFISNSWLTSGVATPHDEKFTSLKEKLLPLNIHRT